jgi:DNA helicase-2/ATP-dependent DNA helicase PcrA
MATGSREEIEEELRLTYVAMTRARDFLYVTWPLRYYHRWHRLTDRHSYAQPSRFLTETVRETVDEVNLCQDEGEDAASEKCGEGDIPSRIKSMWD